MSEVDLSSASTIDDQVANSVTYKLRRLLPMTAAAISYPFLLDAFHLAVSPAGVPISIIRIFTAALCLIAAMAAPSLGLVSGVRMTGAIPSSFELRARRLAYIIVGVPPFFVLTGVALGLLHLHINDELIWVVGWLTACAYVLFGREMKFKPAAQSVTTWRVAHGVTAALVVSFVLFHLTNHLLGLIGPDAHAATMKLGRQVYRSALVEPVLISLMLFQIVSGARLAWRWSSAPVDTYRVFQIGSGTYLAAFILTHLNSALVSARTVHKIETGWAWASGAPTGLIHNAWNIRLVPHYAFGVFFILAHLSSGLRGVIIAHGVDIPVANRMWTAGLVVSGLVSVAIISGLCGARI
jgi:hypothetical protein